MFVTTSTSLHLRYVVFSRLVGHIIPMFYVDCSAGV